MAVQDQPVVKTMPIDLQEIKIQQDTAKCVEKLLGTDKRYHLKNFHGAGHIGLNGTNIELLCYSDKM